MIPFAVAPGVLVSVDPGKRRCGVAVWVDGVLAWAGLVAVRTTARMVWTANRMACAVRDAVLAHGGAGAVWVVEDQVDYPGQGAKQSDLDSLRAVVRSLRAVSDSLSTVRPSEWKGNVPKPVHHRRVRAVLSSAELGRLSSLDLDTLDAVALGLWALGRVGRGGVRAAS